MNEELYLSLETIIICHPGERRKMVRDGPALTVGI